VSVLWFFLLAASAPAQAALAPQYQRQRELMAIVGNPEVLQQIGMIEKVEAVGPDRYRVSSDRCTLAVTIKTAPRTAEVLVGARQFTVNVGARSCR
jgi:hypothetical protein